MPRERAATLRLSITLDTEMRQGLQGHNTIGIVPGRRTDEIVIVNAHADGWFDAAGDNGDGLAVLVALARHFAKAPPPERTLLFVASGGHHGAGMNGPGNLVDDESGSREESGAGAEPRAHRAAVLPQRSVPVSKRPSSRWVSGFRTRRRRSPTWPERGMQRYGFVLRPQFSSSIAGDLGGYAPLGVPRVQAIHSGPMYHTSGDTLDTHLNART